ncbi:MAG: hypothetical protein SAL07_24555 [Oscillatoria sp. PMC 1051.18]|nr:hypothetical protein [Oscillatoria sp. PMC 1051.18]MEC5033081.1 hypothetical protein [Oscillatoria sp. PMC 1051.18]
MFNTVATLHNAIMLSNNIFATLFSVFDNVFQIAGLSWKDADGNTVGFGDAAQVWTYNTAVNLFGETVVNGTLLTWKKANRIYQAGANLLWSVRSLGDSLRSVSELTAEQVSRFFNLAVEDGLLQEHDLMPRRVTARTVAQRKLDRVIDGLDSISEVVETVEEISSGVLEVQGNLTEIVNQRNEFNQALTEGIAESTVEKNEKELESIVPDIEGIHLGKASD